MRIAAFIARSCSLELEECLTVAQALHQFSPVAFERHPFGKGQRLQEVHYANPPRSTVADAAAEVSPHDIDVIVPAVAAKPALRALSRNNDPVVARAALQLHISILVDEIT